MPRGMSPQPHLGPRLFYSSNSVGMRYAREVPTLYGVVFFSNVCLALLMLTNLKINSPSVL